MQTKERRSGLITKCLAMRQATAYALARFLYLVVTAVVVTSLWILFVIRFRQLYNTSLLRAAARSKALARNASTAVYKKQQLELHVGRVQPVYVIDNERAEMRTEVVPDVVHLLRFGNYPFEFIDAVQLRSVYLNHGPEQIIIHTDNPSQLNGYYWNLVKDIPGLLVILDSLPTHTPNGSSFSHVFHASDVKRMQVLYNYGGIYTDRDFMVLRPLRYFFRFEFSSAINNFQFDTMFLVATPRARFLKLFINTYNNYKKNVWYYNAGVVPRQKILVAHKHLMHDIGIESGTGQVVIPYVYNADVDLRNHFYGAHILYRWRHRCFDPRLRNMSHPLNYDTNNIRRYNCSIGRLFREMLFGTSGFVDENAPVLTTKEVALKLGYPVGAKKPYEGDEHLVPNNVNEQSTVVFHSISDFRNYHFTQV